MKILKYPFEVDGEVNIQMPAGARVLTVQVQYGSPCLWAAVVPEAPIETRSFRIFATGQKIDIDLTQAQYIGTFPLREGSFIGHLFEI
ncbi:hypothetical protein LCGC14_0791240 [marine sediment metagenome]|uniref:DUF7352 domain-containing protein n=1 Tax=marine sediment metagenome TaxID=412755 RepID=A0A0F9QCA7_9ZZZZ